MNWRLWLLALSLAVILPAQSWDDLHELKAGVAIKVLDTGGHEVKGAFRSVSADAITLAAEKTEISVERTKVRRVQVRDGNRRVRNAVIGAAVGMAIGVVADQTLGTYMRNEAGQSDSTRALTYVLPIGLFGGIGAALPGFRTVYKAR